MSSLRLGVNIDHVATLRQARYATMPESKNAEPDLLVAARICERAGASGIVAHLRSDRRHIQDHDIERLRQNIMTKLNLEMGNTEEIIDVALRILPDEVCLVPEKREEITTEGGLDVIAQRKELEPTIKRLQVAGIRVSLFINPTLEEVDAAAELGVEMVELHTGSLANAFTEKIQKEELEQLRAASRAASSAARLAASSASRCSRSACSAALRSAMRALRACTSAARASSRAALSGSSAIALARSSCAFLASFAADRRSFKSVDLIAPF